MNIKSLNAWKTLCEENRKDEYAYKMNMPVLASGFIDEGYSIPVFASLMSQAV